MAHRPASDDVAKLGLDDPGQIAVLANMLLTLGAGVEVGVASHVVLSLVLFIYKTSRPQQFSGAFERSDIPVTI